MDLPATDGSPGTRRHAGAQPLQSLFVVPAVSGLVGTLMAVGAAALVAGVLLGMSGRRVRGKSGHGRARS